MRFGVNVAEILRGEGGGPRAVRLEAGEEIACDLVVSAIGVVPNTKFLEGSGMALSKGGAIEVDDALRTSAPDVYAAGDCANVTWADGSRRPEQLWYTARDQGRLAARAMLGDEVVYRRGTWYNSAKFFDIEWTTAGWVPVLLNWDNTPLDPGPDVRSWFQRVPGQFVSQRIVVKGDRVVGFNMLGSRWDHEPLLQWIHERRSLDYVLEHLPEAQFDEEFMPRFRVLPQRGRRSLKAEVLMQAGLMNTYQHPVSSRQPVAWLCSAVLVVAYLLLYFGGNPHRGFAADPVQRLAEGIAAAWPCPRPSTASGCSTAFLYTLAMVVGGIFMLKRHGNSRYQRIRTTVVVSSRSCSPSPCPWS